MSRLQITGIVGTSLFLLGVIGALCDQQESESEAMSFTILQLNDVYEIAPLPGLNEGGMARVAAFRKELQRSDPRLITVLAGDFLSPSALGHQSETDLTGEKQTIAGRQMVEVMNATGVKVVTFGNHEFDIKKDELQRRIDESEFEWVASNVSQKSDGRPFAKHNQPIPAFTKIPFEYYPDKVLNVGIIGVTIDSKYDYALTSNYITAVRGVCEELKGDCQVIVALTHLEYKSDSILALSIPELDLIIGGHEHENKLQTVNRTVISKADANAKSAYVHNIFYDPGTANVKIQSRLKGIDGGMKSDAPVEMLVDGWMKKCYDLLRQRGYEPMRQVYSSAQALDGIDNHVRFRDTNYTDLIVEAMDWAVDGEDPVIFNSGSLRVDDMLSHHVIEYDVFRSLPYGGSVYVVNVLGKNLVNGIRLGMRKDCDQADPACKKGSGGFLHGKNIELKDGRVLFKGKPVDESKEYPVLMPSYLANGCEKDLEMLNGRLTDPHLRAGVRNDIIDIVIAYMKEKEKEKDQKRQ